jgi:alkanesulfonate monooxygenase SsuD/methylene tetrahydromethanopterin reductase-like flavin-dependent oxidoreductase (luciferase family)
MRLGISLTSRLDVDHPREGAADLVARARAARAAGLDLLCIGDHHATPVPYYQNVPTLGRLLAEWSGGQAGALFLLPLWHPVLVAEQIGTLAAFADGPFVVQTGLGGGHEQFAAMGVPLKGRAAVYDESLRVVAALLAGETVSSETFGIVDACISPVPAEPVEWWIGAGAPAAMERVARLGADWYGNADLTPSTARAQIAVLREACDRHGHVPRKLAVRKDVIVLDDGDEARRLGDALMAGGYRGLPHDAVAYGSPSDVAEQLAVYADLGVTDIVVRTMAVPAAVAHRSIEGLGEVRRRLA